MSVPRPADTAGSYLLPANRLLLVLLLAFLARLLAAPHFTFDGTDCDGAGYWDVAKSLAQGRGWVSHSYRFLYLTPPPLPGPDMHWSPLYPLLMAGAFKGLGVSMEAARWPMLLLGTLLAGAVALLTGRLTHDKNAATLAGLMAALHPTLLVWSLRLETEVGTMLLVTLTLWALARQESWRDAVLAGLCLGLAWLMKYQSGLLVLAAVTGALLAPQVGSGWRRGPALRRLALTLVVFSIVIAPWLIRNALCFGDPFFSAVGPMVLSGYRQFGSERAFITSTTPPPATLPFLLGHLPEVVGRGIFGVRYLLGGFLREHAGSLLLWPLLLIGAAAVARGEWRRWLPALVWAAGLVAACAISIHQVRYVLSLLPLLIALAATAVTLPRPAWARLALGLLGLLATADMGRRAQAAVDVRGVGWTPGAMSCALESQAAAAWLMAHTAPGETIFATEVYHYALVSERNAVNIPPREEDLNRLRDRYGIRYLAIAERDLPTRLPGWVPVAPVGVTLDTTLTPPSGHGTSPIRIYGLRPR